MSNIIDYLDWRGDLTFAQSAFNDVDNLILSALAYMHFDGLCDDWRAMYDVGAVRRAYEEKGNKSYGVLSDPSELFRRVCDSARFGNMRVGYFVNEVDREREMQFSAVTFALDDGSIFVSYRGTDDNIVGWREDFNFSFMAETPAQQRAVEYLNAAAETFDSPIRAGGHSKGGNLAVYAFAFCDPTVGDRVIKVYSNDGPGFNKSVAQTPEMSAALEKAELIIPESSIVGILLSNDIPKKVIKSNVSGPMQHDLYSWCVLGDRFVASDAKSAGSMFMDETLNRWIDSLDDEQRNNLTVTLFDLLDASGAETLTEMRSSPRASAGAMFKSLVRMDKSQHRELTEIIKKLAGSGGEVLREEYKKRKEQKHN